MNKGTHMEKTTFAQYLSCICMRKPAPAKLCLLLHFLDGIPLDLVSIEQGISQQLMRKRVSGEAGGDTATGTAPVMNLVQTGFQMAPGLRKMLSFPKFNQYLKTLQTVWEVLELGVPPWKSMPFSFFITGFLLMLNIY